MEATDPRARAWSQEAGHGPEHRRPPGGRGAGLLEPDNGQGRRRRVWVGPRSGGPLGWGPLGCGTEGGVGTASAQDPPPAP